MVPFSLPSFAPSNLQHNLLSYLVRRFLGPLLKNGAESLDNQLATPTIPGNFTLKDVQLNPDALADHLSGAFSSFSIQEVSVSELSLQINWPSWSFSLQGYVPDVKVTFEGIQVTLGLSEHQSNCPSLLPQINLEESLATIANDFVHQELAESSVYDDRMDQDFPGAFTTRTNPNLPPSSSDEDQLGFFAGLVQKILAKFNFELNHFTLLFKHQALELLLSIDHIKSLDLTADDVQPSSSISREIRTSCPVIYLQHLSDQAQADSLPSPCNSTSTQSYDSEHDMLMSQATVDLRRPGSLFVSAAEIQNPIQEQLPDKTPLSQSIMKPENILLQFMSGTLTNETAEVSKSSTNSPLSSEAKPSHEDSEELLNPNNSLRFLFWVFHNSSSASTDEAPLDTDKPDSTGPSKQDTTPQSSPQRPRLNIQIDLPLVELSIRLPRDLNALTCLVSTFNSAIPSTSTDSASNVPTSASPTPSLIISAVLRLRALNCTLAFPTPYPQSLPRCDNTPLSSLNVQAHVINLVFNALPAYPVNQDQATQPQYELTLRVDKIKGRSEIRHMQSSTCHNSVFLLAPARDDHLCPAVCISRTVETVQIVFSSIWLNLDLEVVAFLIPLVKALQSTPVINRMSSRNLSGKVVGDQTILPSLSSGLSHTSLEDEYGNLKEDDNFKTTVSIPCLYVDIKSPTQRQPSHDRSQPDLILGLVLKTFQLIITSQKQIGCSAFQVALGFRIGHTAEERAHAPLSPFLGIAHSCIPSSTDQQNRFTGLRLTHIFSHPQSQKLARNPSGPQRPTSIKLETVTIDLSKDQFDRLQYWIDDLGQWANSLFIDPPPTPFDRHTQPSSLDDTNTQRSGSRSGLETRLEKMRVDNDKDAVPSLLASLTVSKIALTIRLPPDNLQPKREAAPFKLVIQLELISIDQFRLPFHDEFNDQTRLLIRTCSASIHPQHQQPNTQSLPILYQAHPHLPKVQDKSSVSSAVSVEVNTATQPQAINQQLSRKKILVNVHVNHSIVRLGPCCIWTSELARFLKAPAGVFEAVGPEYQSRINFELIGCAIQLVSPSPPPLSPASTTATTSSACDFQSGNDHGPYPDSSFILQVMADHAQLKLALDPSSTAVSPSLSASIAVSLAECPASILSASPSSPSSSEKIGFAPIIALNDLYVSLVYSWTPGRPTSRTILHRGSLAVSLCADSADSLAEAISRFSEISFQAKQDAIHNDVQVSSENQRGEDPIVASTMLRSAMREPSSLPRSILIQKDEDLIEEDYPTDVAFLDQAQPASSHHHPLINHSAPAILRSISGQGLNIIDDYLLRTPASSSKVLRQAIETEVQVEQLDVLVRFHDGYDWSSTRQTIQQAQKTVRKRLQKIRQLLATGNPADARSIEEDLGPTTLFKSLHLGLDSSTRGLSTAQLLDAIDDQLVKEAVEPVSDDPESMAGSWQSLTPHPPNELPQPRLVSVPSSKQRQLCRSTQPMLKIVLDRVQGHFRKYYHDRESGDTKASDSSDCRLSSLQLKTDTLTIIDNIPTSTWKKFLTELRPGEGGMMRPTGAPMVRVKFVVTPSARDFCLKEAIVKLKISPLRLYVDQDAVDFLKTFFSFQKSPSSSAPIPSIPDSSAAPPANGELFFQRVEILPIRIKLDYKPKRVNYMALKGGKAIELMNFFHFEGSDMVLRHATLTGISRASKIGELLQEIWTPDVKANQLADVISGIAPVRSVVNLGTGIADLVLLPIEEMKKKDGRLSRGIQKGTSSFAKNTTLEVIKLGARLAIGTQVVLEKAESILGAKFHQELCGETIEHLPSPDPNLATSDHHPTGLASHHHQHELVSRYALQPENFKVGAQSALHDLRDNFRSTAQTILAVPLEVFNEGSGQAVVKAIPIAILHPMVGATGAISKTLLGLHNSLDPLGSTDHRLDKYKQLHLPSSSSSSSKSSPSPS